jgi:hypothetical protein
VIDPAVVLLLSACTSLLFGTAAIHKLAAIEEFKAALLAYDILPAGIVRLVSYIVPVGELLAAIGLCIGPLRAWAIVIAALVLSLYALAIGVNLRRGRRYIDCGCVGFGNRRSIAPWMVVRNFALALVLVSFDLLSWSVRPFRWIDVVTIAGGALIIVFLYLAAEQLLGRQTYVMRAEAAAK